MPPAIATRIVPGREKNDCAICVLAMYLGASYEDVLRAVATRDRPNQGRQGLSLKEIERIARDLGTPLRRHRKFDPAAAYGILSVPHHVVLLRGGMVIDPETNGGSVWEVEDYLHTYGVRPGVLLVAREDEVPSASSTRPRAGRSRVRSGRRPTRRRPGSPSR